MFAISVHVCQDKSGAQRIRQAVQVGINIAIYNTILISIVATGFNTVSNTIVI